MSKKRLKWMCISVLIAVMGLSLIASSAFAEKAGSGSKEGIKVHGHWKIEVFNPDGTRVSSTEFENALEAQGVTFLVNSLTGESLFGAWSVVLGGTPSQPCDNGSGGQQSCKIGESGVTYPLLRNSTNLSVDGSSGTSIVLSGSVTVDYDSTINQVETDLMSCADKTISLNTCRPNPVVHVNFTSATLGTQPSVVAGQLVQVTVTISFS